MYSPRPNRHFATLLRLCAVPCLLSISAGIASAQTPADSVPAPQQPTPPAAMPAPVPVKPTPESPNVLPSMPAYVQKDTPPPAAPAPSSTDPLQTPVVVPPGPTAPDSAMPRPVPTPRNQLSYLPAYQLVPGIKYHVDHLGSTYIPVDSHIYDMALRLYSLGYLDTAFINMRPWTRRSLLHMLQDSSGTIIASGDVEAADILAKLDAYLIDEVPDNDMDRGNIYGVHTVYDRVLGINGQTLRDSYHLGQTISNDYGRPYQAGFNNIAGFSTVAEVGRFSLYVRGEYQHSPSGAGYSIPLTAQLSNIDGIYYGSPSQNLFGGNNYSQDTIPTGPIAAVNPFRLQEAFLSFHILGHEISGGKSDAWLGPGYGGAMAWSNNAENIYSFRINRIEPLHIPLVSRVLGPLRYDFFVGSLKGHSYPNSPWIHSEMFSFAPSSNFQFAFQRSVIWGGEGHEAITLHTFFHSFFSINDTTGAEKIGNQDPGARFSDFSMSYRLPFVRHYLTLYVDSIAHDDVTPISAPRRAAYRPGIYLSQVPGLHKLDFRVEAASTDTSTLRSLNGDFNYYEVIQRQGYTNKGFIMGDWIGREAKGGQAWLTYHLSGNEFIQLEYMDKKTPKDFIPGGTTQGQFKAEVVKRLSKNIELDAWLQYERWKAPIYIPGNNANSDTAVAFQVTYFPRLRSSHMLNGK